MTLNEAIKHEEKAAEKNEKKAKSYPRPDRSVRGSGRKYNDCIECASEHRRLAEWLKELKQLREQEPCEDCISRQVVLNYIRDNYRRWFINDDAFIQCVNGIKDIVPVTSQQKMGRWKPYDGSWYECSECGAVREAVGFFENYCPNCGRKMEVDDE